MATVPRVFFCCTCASPVHLAQEKEIHNGRRPMKTIRLPLVIGFVVAAFIGFLLGNFRNGGEAARDKALDLSIARDLTQDVHICDLVLETARTNSCEKAEGILRNYAWGELRVAWDASKAYPGELDDELRPLFLNVYPRLKQRLDFQMATSNRSPIELQEMTNFMNDVEKLQSQTKNPINP